MEIVFVLIRLAGFLAGATLFGAPLFALCNPPLAEIVASRLKPMLMTAACLSAAAAMAGLVMQTGRMAGDPAAGLDPATLGDVVRGTGFGASVLVRTGATLLALGLLVGLRPPRQLWTLTTILGAVGLAALAWAGHGAADEGIAGLVHTAADIAHLLAAGAWLGALMMFVLALEAGGCGAAEAPVIHRALKDFSGVGSIAVAVIVASGLANGWFLVGLGHLGGLAVSPWGWLLIVKLVLFALMLAFAALNRFRLTPRLDAARSGDPGAAISALRYSIGLEFALGVGVLALVAALGVLTPPVSAP